MSKNVNYIGTNYELVSCSFDVNQPELSKNYIYKCDLDIEINKGDLAVVESSTDYD